MMTYEDFRAKIQKALRVAHTALTWTEIRTTVGLSQAFPNNQWVRRMDKDINLAREKDNNGIIHWKLL